MTSAPFQIRLLDYFFHATIVAQAPRELKE